VLSAPGLRGHLKQAIRKGSSACSLLKQRLRELYLRSVLADLGEGSRVFGTVVVHGPENVTIGHHTNLNDGVLLNARGRITIGNHVHLSAGCIVTTTGLNYDKTGSERDHFAADVTIADGAWIGAGAVINPGVTVGRDAIVGAGAVVVESVPDATIVVGVPARPLRQLPHNQS
jgi:acetyltransferase-like isoleucine patch superfamily enzyme